LLWRRRTTGGGREHDDFFCNSAHRTKKRKHFSNCSKRGISLSLSFSLCSCSFPRVSFVSHANRIVFCLRRRQRAKAGRCRENSKRRFASGSTAADVERETKTKASKKMPQQKRTLADELADLATAAPEQGTDAHAQRFDLCYTLMTSLVEACCERERERARERMTFLLEH